MPEVEEKMAAAGLSFKDLAAFISTKSINPPSIAELVTLSPSYPLLSSTSSSAIKEGVPSVLHSAAAMKAYKNVLSGKTTLEKIEKLSFGRQNGLLPLRPRAWPQVSDQRTVAICLV